jgi:hypothetical protein
MLRKLPKALFFWLSAELLIFGLDVFFSIPFFKGFSLEQIVVSDVSLNDLHYKINGSASAEWDGLSGKIILINTGSLDPNQFRYQLAGVINNLENLNPATIVIDHEFAHSTFQSDSGTLELRKAIQGNAHIIIGKKFREKGNRESLGTAIKYANADFPEGQFSVRRYYSDTNTIAWNIAKKINPEAVPLKNENFLINYVASTSDFFTLDDPEIHFLHNNPKQKFGKFLLIPADVILTMDSAALLNFKRICSGKALILGHFGSRGIRHYMYDVEDKHPVPNDTNSFYNRQSSMPGMMIHAIAAENLLNPDFRFSAWSDGMLYALIYHVLFFGYIYYLLYYNIGNLYNILILGAASIPFLYFVLYLMRYGIYIETGLKLVAIMAIEETFESVDSIFSSIKSLWKRKLKAS